MLVPGLDDILLSLTPVNGDLSIDLAFLSTIVDGKNLQIIGYRDGSIAALASYDIAELAAGLGKCADSVASRRYSRLLAKARPEADLR